MILTFFRAHKQTQPLPEASAIPSKETETSAIIIQKLWRGYRARKRTKSIAEKLQRKRTQDYIKKLTTDMEVTKEALENERKIQQLQMQAISALWKKVSAMQGGQTSSSSSSGQESGQIEGGGVSVVQDLAKTCSMLTSQVQQLQGSMRDIVNCMTMFCNLPQGAMGAGSQPIGPEMRDCSGTQTEIVAVHTPQVENPPFPFGGGHPQRVSRPSTLPLETPESSHAAVEALEEDIPDAVEAKDEQQIDAAETKE